MAPTDDLSIPCPDVRITHTYVWAWDTLLGSFPGWKAARQIKASEDLAPLLAVYFDGARWVTLHELPDDTRFRVERLARELGISDGS